MMTSPSRFRLLGFTVAVALLLLVPLTAPIVTRGQDQGVVINQVYAGGQSGQAPLRADYIELFNPGTDPVALDGWSVQYAADDGTTWRGTTLTGTIPAGGFYLVQGAPGRPGWNCRPPMPPVVSPSPAGSGRIALVASAAPLTCGADPACATAPDVIDFVGYGPGRSVSKGTAPARSPGVERALVRDAGGCTDTDDNATDFLVRLPTPRNSAAPPEPCGAGTRPRSAGRPSAPPRSPGWCASTTSRVQPPSRRCSGRAWSTCRGWSPRWPATGFWMQDPQPDTDAATSEGILVFLNALPQVQVGRCGAGQWAGRGVPARQRGRQSDHHRDPRADVSRSSAATSSCRSLPTVLGPAGRLLPTEVIDDDATGDVESQRHSSMPAATAWTSGRAWKGCWWRSMTRWWSGPRSRDGDDPGPGQWWRRGDRPHRPRRHRPQARAAGTGLQPGADRPRRCAPAWRRASGEVDTGDRIPDPVIGVVDYGLPATASSPRPRSPSPPATLQPEVDRLSRSQ